MPYTFPSLSQSPAITPWEEQAAFDPTISVPAQGGYRQTRPRFTRIPSKWTLGYLVLPQADKTLIRGLEGDVKIGAEQFSWTNPLDSVVYQVRFLGPVRYKMHGSKFYWDVEFEIEEV